MVARLGQAKNFNKHWTSIIKITLNEKRFESYNICPCKKLMRVNSNINLQAVDRQCLVLVDTLYNKGELFLTTLSRETFHYVMKPVQWPFWISLFQTSKCLRPHLLGPIGPLKFASGHRKLKNLRCHWPDLDTQLKC